MFVHQETISSRQWARLGATLAVLVLILCGAAVRIIAVFDAFWLDEIWSWGFATQTDSAWRIFSGPLSDNNHPLNTLFMYWLGDREAWWLYRLPALIAGVAAIAVAARSGRSWGRAAGVIMALLVAISLQQVVYASEARGYAPAVLLALLAYASLRACLVEGRRGAWLSFALLSTLGLFTHLTFAHFSLAALLWSLVRALRARAERGREWVGLLACHGLPLIALVMIGARRMAIGGGPEWRSGEILVRTLAEVLGTPAALPFAVPTGVLILVFLVWDALRARSDEWVFTLAAVLVVPVASVLVLQPEILFPRYFLVAATFLLLALARVLGRLWEAEGLRRWLAVSLILAFCLAQSAQLLPFLRYGRGDYLGALEHLRARTRGETISVGGDHDFRNRWVLRFYRRYLGAHAERFVYHRRESWPTGGPEWLLTQSQEAAPTPPREIRTPPEGSYLLERSFPFSGPSGWHWFVYRRSDDAPRQAHSESR